MLFGVIQATRWSAEERYRVECLEATLNFFTNRCLSNVESLSERAASFPAILRSTFKSSFPLSRPRPLAHSVANRCHARLRPLRRNFAGNQNLRRPVGRTLWAKYNSHTLDQGWRLVLPSIQLLRRGSHPGGNLVRGNVNVHNRDFIPTISRVRICVAHSSSTPCLRQESCAPGRYGAGAAGGGSCRASIFA
jgi:hypothetical protein